MPPSTHAHASAQGGKWHATPRHETLRYSTKLLEPYHIVVDHVKASPRDKGSLPQRDDGSRKSHGGDQEHQEQPGCADALDPGHRSVRLHDMMSASSRHQGAKTARQSITKRVTQRKAQIEETVEMGLVDELPTRSGGFEEKTTSTARSSYTCRVPVRGANPNAHVQVHAYALVHRVLELHRSVTETEVARYEGRISTTATAFVCTG